MASNPAIKKTHPVPMFVRLLRLFFKYPGKLIPRFSTKLAEKLWFTPARYPTPETEKHALETASISSNIINEHEITTYSWGHSDKKVLLVHGWSGRGTQLGSFIQPLIDANYQVISFDAPAHGTSSGKQTNIFEVSKVLNKLSEKFNGFDSVITHSFGGLCVAHAIKNGFTVNRLAFVCPPQTSIGLIDKFSSALHIPETIRLKLKENMEQQFGNDVWSVTSTENNISTVNQKGLVVHDRNDTEIPFSEGRAIAEAWNNSTFVQTTGLGHRRILRDNSTVRHVTSFVTAE